jgi:hypothetical protein
VNDATDDPADTLRQPSHACAGETRIRHGANALPDGVGNQSSSDGDQEDETKRLRDEI